MDGTHTYVYGLDLISSVDGSGNEVYYSQDALGSTAVITDDAGAALGSYQYKAFGEVLDHAGDDADPWLFAGEQRDAALGFDYLRARYYDPAIGRFITRDPWPGNLAQPSTQTAYPYVVNHPTGLVDPSGRCFGWDWCEDELGEGWDALSSAAGDVGGVIADNYGPPFNFSRVVQLADLAGTQAFCYGGAVGIGVLGGFGTSLSLIRACHRIDQVVGVAAFATTEWGILQSDCGLGRKVAASGMNAFNLFADLDEDTPYYRRAAYEHGLYVATNSVYTCSSDGSGSVSKE